DQTRQSVRLVQTAEEEIGDQGRGVRHQGSLVVAPLLGPPDEILRVFEPADELAVDQLRHGSAPQNRSLLANGSATRAKFECPMVRSVNVRIGPSRVSCVR